MRSIRVRRPPFLRLQRAFHLKPRRGMHVFERIWRPIDPDRNVPLKRGFENPNLKKLPKTPARTRFAPSPTGYLHIGSLRTCLYNWLLAKRTGGKFILRLEDTDQTRVVADAADRLYEDLKWAGLDWDEGPGKGGDFGPYIQSERLSIYQEHAKLLIDQGKAYRCFCKQEDLDASRAERPSIGPGEEASDYRYPKICLHIKPTWAEMRAKRGDPFCIRFNADRGPEARCQVVDDLVYGRTEFSTIEDDFVLIKTDGYPTYHFASVVDDHLMKISHVIRGQEWLTSTSRHLRLYKAFEWKPPIFAHVGLLVDQQNQKLSKRTGSEEVRELREKGFLPVALLNHTVLLGWTPKNKEGKSRVEVLTVEDMVKGFHLSFTKGNVKINSKMAYLQKKHVKQLLKNDSEFFESIEAYVRQGIDKMEEERKSSPHSELGPLVPQVSATDNSTRSKYLQTALKLDKGGLSLTKDGQWLQNSKYLFWTVPDDVYRSQLAEAVEDFEYGFIRPARGKLLPTRVDRIYRPSELIGHLRQRLQFLVDEGKYRWTEEYLLGNFEPTIRSVYKLDKHAEGPEVWGFWVMRWAINASMSGPMLISVIHALGREESMRRIKAAESVAWEWEKTNLPEPPVARKSKEGVEETSCPAPLLAGKSEEKVEETS